MELALGTASPTLERSVWGGTVAPKGRRLAKVLATQSCEPSSFPVTTQPATDPYKGELAGFRTHHGFRGPVETLHDLLGHRGTDAHPEGHRRDEDVAPLDFREDVRPRVPLALIVADPGQDAVVRHPHDFRLDLRLDLVEAVDEELAERLGVGGSRAGPG